MIRRIQKLLLVHLHRVDYDMSLTRHQAAASRDWNEADVAQLVSARPEPGSSMRASSTKWFYHAGRNSTHRPS